MNTNASNVEDINIVQIKECLLLSFIASFEHLSSIIHPAKNDCVLNGMSDSVAVLESISSSSMSNLSVC